MKTDSDPRATPPRTEPPWPPAPVPEEPYYRRGEQARRWGGLLVLTGVIWLVFALASRGSLFGLGLVERTATVAPQTYAVERVVLNGVSDHVELIGWDKEGVQVEAVKHAYGWSGGAAEEALDELELIVDERSGTLSIEVRRPIGSFIGRAPYAELRIALPEGASVETHLVSGDIGVTDVSGAMSLTTVSGDLDARDTAGELRAATTSGDLLVRSHRGPLTAESVSGDVTVGGALESPNVKTVSGDASLDGATGAVVLSSISGDLSLTDADEAVLSIESTSGEVEAATSLAAGSASRISNISGDVRVTLENPANLRLDVSTASGEISTDLESVDEERRSLTATIGAGETVLTINTTSGDVTVDGE